MGNGTVFMVTFVVVYLIMKKMMEDKNDGVEFEKPAPAVERSFGWIFWRLLTGGIVVNTLLYLIVK